MAKAKMDAYANKAIERCTMSAANTLTFQVVNFAAGVFQRIALVIHRVVYSPGDGLRVEMLTETDLCWMALTVSNGITDLALTHPEIIDLLKIQGWDMGTAASGGTDEWPRVHDLTSLPGGGWIVPASPIYLAMASSGLVSAMAFDCEIDFTFIELSDADYIELVQSRIKANV